jgi:hypothetical protein
MMKLSALNAFNKLILRIFLVLFSIFIISTIFTGSALAEENGDSLDLGWILFYITLVVLIVIVILWIVTYLIMRNVIKRLQADSDKIRRYEKRKDADSDRRRSEKERDHKRRARAPKGNCLVCNRKFIPGADAYQCECGKFMHIHCLAEMSICPNCGREIDKDYGVVRVEDSKGPESVGGGSRTKVSRILKAKLCPVCNKIIKAGETAMQCDGCESLMHIKCSDKTRRCPKCGN